MNKITISVLFMILCPALSASESPSTQPAADTDSAMARVAIPDESTAAAERDPAEPSTTATTQPFLEKEVTSDSASTSQPAAPPALSEPQQKLDYIITTPAVELELAPPKGAKAGSVMRVVFRDEFQQEWTTTSAVASGKPTRITFSTEGIYEIKIECGELLDARTFKANPALTSQHRWLVDWTAPAVDLISTTLTDNRLIVNWLAFDQNMAPEPISIYAVNKNGLSLLLTSANSGWADLRIDPAVLPCRIRLVAKDLAGHTTAMESGMLPTAEGQEAELAQPVTIAGETAASHPGVHEKGKESHPLTGEEVAAKQPGVAPGLSHVEPSVAPIEPVDPSGDLHAEAHSPAATDRRAEADWSAPPAESAESAEPEAFGPSRKAPSSLKPAPSAEALEPVAGPAHRPSPAMRTDRNTYAVKPSHSRAAHRDATARPKTSLEDVPAAKDSSTEKTADESVETSLEHTEEKEVATGSPRVASETHATKADAAVDEDSTEGAELSNVASDVTATTSQTPHGSPDAAEKTSASSEAGPAETEGDAAVKPSAAPSPQPAEVKKSAPAARVEAQEEKTSAAAAAVVASKKSAPARASAEVKKSVPVAAAVAPKVSASAGKVSGHATKKAVVTDAGSATAAREAGKSSHSASISPVPEEYGPARREVSTVRTVSPEVLAYFKKGERSRQAGDYSLAITSYRQALERSPNFVQARLELAGVLSSLGRYNDAQAHYRKVLELDSTQEKAWLGLGLVLGRQQKADEARECFENLLQENPRNVAGWMYLGDAHWMLGARSQAILTWKRARALAQEQHLAALVRTIDQRCQLDRSVGQ